MTEDFTGGKVDGIAFNQEEKTVRMLLGRTAVTVPFTVMPDLLKYVEGIVDALRVHGHLPPAPKVLGLNLISWQIGASNIPSQEHFTALLLDDGTPQEVLRFMPDLSALRLADAIEQKVFSHMSNEDQKIVLKQVEAERNGSPLPAAAKIILPGGTRH